MLEYIEREKLIEKIVNTPTVPIRRCYEGNFVYADGTASRQNEIIDYIKEQPTADVVEVVRCKGCEHKKEIPNCQKELYSSSCVACSYHSGLIMDGNDFCSYGKKERRC